MKKVLLVFVGLLGFLGVVHAQYAPKKGDVAVEIGFSPFRDNGETFKLNEGMLKVRYFLTGKDVLRLKLGIGVDNTNNKTTDFQDASDKTVPYSITSGTTEKTNKYTKFSLSLGYERHIKTIKRLDLYAGAEVGYGSDAYSGKEYSESMKTSYSSGGDVSGSVYNSHVKEYVNMNIDGDNVSNRYFTASIFTGLDFYVYKNLYVGAEIGINFKTGKSPNHYYNEESKNIGANKYGEVTYRRVSTYDGETGLLVLSRNSDGSLTEERSYSPVYNKEVTNTKLKFFAEPSIRLGWRF